MQKIKLTQGKYALVDDEDFEALNQFKWIAEKIGKNWYASRSSYKKGQHALIGKLSKAMIRMHRLILDFPKGLIDHIDRNGLNNQRKNLRVGNKRTNAVNTGLWNTNTSGYKGVFRVVNKTCIRWNARIVVNKKSINLGTYETVEEAVLARKKADKLYENN